MLFKLFLLFTLVPLLELVLLYYLADHTSLGFTLALILLTGLIGAALARRQGWQTSQRIQKELSQGHMPGDALFDGLLILVAGALLVTPGVLTDVVGFALLVPGCRRIIKRRIVRKVTERFRMRGFTVDEGFSKSDEQASHDVIIDARVVDTKEPEKDRDDTQRPS